MLFSGLFVFTEKAFEMSVTATQQLITDHHSQRDTAYKDSKQTLVIAALKMRLIA